MEHFEQPARNLDSILDRIRSLLLLQDRVLIEMRVKKQPHDRAQLAKNNQELMVSLAEQSVSPEERRLLEAGPGTWMEADLINASWRVESLGVLLWAVGLLDALPEWDEQLDYLRLTEIVGATATPARLRALKDLSEWHTQAERWHWRARQTQGFFNSFRQGNISADQKAALVRRALGSSNARLFKKPYEDLTFQEFATTLSISIERHYALNWLWYGADWDNVLTDT